MSCLSGKRQFTGEGPRKAVYVPNLLPSLRLLRLVIFFFFFLRYYWLLREQLFPSLLLFRITILTLTDRQLMGGKLDCVHEEIQFSDETNALHRGEFVASLREASRVQVQTRSGISLDRLRVSTVVRSSAARRIHILPCVCLSLY